MKLALVLAGGGTSGYISASILERIEDELNLCFNEDVDLIAGVSTGALIGGLLSKGLYTYQIKDIYVNFFDRVFGGQRNYFKLLFGSLYDNKELENVLVDIIGNIRMSHCEIPFMCHALQLNKPSLTPKFWKSWEDDIKLREPLVASSCAPFAFKPYKIEDKFYYDGGLCINEPSMPLIAELYALGKEKDTKVLSIQTDYNEGYRSPSAVTGAFNLIPKLLNLCIDSTERSSEYMAKNIHKEKYLNINPRCYFDIDDDNWSEMDKVVDEVWKRESEGIKRFLEV